MKKQVLLITLCSGYFLSLALENAPISYNLATVKNIQTDEIDLRGRIEPGEIRRQSIAVSAYVEEANIKAKFHFDIESIQITILNGIGNTVYYNTVVSTLGELLIPISNLQNGNYTISFTTKRGTLTGNFVL